MLPERMSRAELRAGASLAGVYGLRMLGLFSILPVFAVHAAKLKGADLALVGIALGVYGLSQGILQIPFGLASDRWGSGESGVCRRWGSRTSPGLICVKIAGGKPNACTESVLFPEWIRSPSPASMR